MRTINAFKMASVFVFGISLALVLGCDGGSSADEGGEAVTESGEEADTEEGGAEGESTCEPSCDGKDCGDDGCGGICGACQLGIACIGGICIDIENCVSDEGCEESGAVSCTDDGVGYRECIEVVPGCLKWGAPSGCVEGEACVDGACACVPACDDKECGDDGCGGNCGFCGDSECVDGICTNGCDVCGPPGDEPLCDPDDLHAVVVCEEVDGCKVWTTQRCPDGGVCEAGACVVCEPECAGKECGSDGCGGSCGECDDGTCVEGVCSVGCDECDLSELPKCDPNDPAGVMVCVEENGCLKWKAEACPDNGSYCVDGVCVAETCDPACDGKECGDDGCDGSCGICSDGESCVEGLCEEDVPKGAFGEPCTENNDCESGFCLSAQEEQFCTETCLDECPEGWECTALGEDPAVDMIFLCVPIGECTPNCDEKNCGNDGCGFVCGVCGGGEYCVDGICTEDCEPSCDGKECGSNGCGGGCGICEGGAVCSEEGVCGSVCEECSFDPACLNMSFESGDLSGWDAEGAIVVPWLGETAPTDGQFMMLLSTGGFVENAQSSEASISTCVPEEALLLSFDWKFFSEEFLEWCGSSFQDSFIIQVVTPEGTTTLLDYTIDDFCPGGSSGIEVEEADVSFDQGGVYVTPWVTTSVALDPSLAGAPFKLRFFASDAGDAAFDTVILVDNIRFETCEPVCDGKECGDDGCAGECGSCAPDEKCSLNGICKPVPCDENGNCPDDMECCSTSGSALCVSEGSCCEASCEGKTCGDNGCGGECGSCSLDAQCSAEGVCEEILCAADGGCPDGLECCSSPDVSICVEVGSCEVVDVNSCEGNCGGVALSGCFCNSFCTLVGNCCPDYEEICEGGGSQFCEADGDCEEEWECCDPLGIGQGVCVQDGSCIDEQNPSSCVGYCEGVAPAGCGCSADCAVTENCCADYKEECGPPPGICDPACDTTVIVAEGDQVTPATTIHLSVEVADSVACDAQSYAWEVKAPTVCATFSPNAAVATPSMAMNMVGTYELSVSVADGNGIQGCLSEGLLVAVIPDNLIHVELVWETEADQSPLGDPCDQGPEAGADLDLHFSHPFAAGADVDEDGVPDGWFDQPYDCFWFNPNPEWGSLDPTVNDNPNLLLDDTDGSGPEAITLHTIEFGAIYKIGVHYWNDFGLGVSDASIRVYYMGAELLYWPDVSLEDKDMWEVATLNGSTGVISEIVGTDGGPKIIHDYQSPFSPGP